MPRGKARVHCLLCATPSKRVGNVAQRWWLHVLFVRWRCIQSTPLLDKFWALNFTLSGEASSQNNFGKIIRTGDWSTRGTLCREFSWIVGGSLLIQPCVYQFFRIGISTWIGFAKIVCAGRGWGKMAQQRYRLCSWLKKCVRGSKEGFTDVL